MKVAFVAWAQSWHTYRWYKSLRDKCDIKVFSFNKGPDLYGEDQIVIKSILPKKLKYIFGAASMRKSVRKFNPDILHAHYATGHGYVGSKLKIRPFIVSVWGSDIFDFPHKSNHTRAFVRKVLDKADAICATSQRLKNGTLALYPEFESKINVIPFGIDMKLFQPSKSEKTEDQITIGTSKLLEDIYQIDLLMKIFDRIAEDCPNIYLRIAGKGPEMANLLKVKDELANGDRIKFLGQVENDKIPDFLNQLDIFAMPSKFESFGVSALEASACGLPVVAFKVGGLPEILDDGVSALFAAEGDNLAFEINLRTLVEDRELRLKMGSAGRDIVAEKYDIVKTTQMQLDLYKSLL
ncbi:MAG: glycosyltransferase [candidate division Zixibacteria bacterium]|nr:glycosyltransferase [candidate division Zixibacteria bacterium]